MPDADLIRTIHTKYRAMLTELDERGTRRWAVAIGRGGISAVSVATGISRATIRKGIAELSLPVGAEELPPDRQRRAETGLEVHAWLDAADYPAQLKISDKQLAEVQIVRNKFHGEWNYEIRPHT